MHISFVDIQNFRKLRQCRIAFSNTKTLFVGANNSGKTSAMDALGKFLAGRHFVYNDITVSNRSVINAIGDEWQTASCEKPENIEKWDDILPTLDVWLDVSENEIQYVAHIIPTLKWRKGVLGVRLVYQPKDIEKLFLEYRVEYASARKTESSAKKSRITLWPKNLSEFLEKKLAAHFVLKSYILDPAKSSDVIPQKTVYEMECINQNPLDGLIKIDMIGAQRGFSDPEHTNIEGEGLGSSLSTQLRSYYDKHLDPEKAPTPEDLTTLLAMENATEVFNKSLTQKFASAISELENLGYPGLNDPKVTIETKISAGNALQHDSAVQYAMDKSGASDLKLPEKYNGLGYQNLISIVFRLMRFRDDWMQEGKAKREKEIDQQRIEPLHLVLLEEPEAHLHVQVQQVLIRKSYEVLTKHEFLVKHPTFITQLVVSTHSSHIAKEVPFANLRYFKRISASQECSIATAKVISLEDVFGKDDETNKFVTRYLQTTHCDLFFADAAIFVEGAAESMLIPHFIQNKYQGLYQRYISILSINGKHSHRLKPLIEKLCLTTLVIADIDSAEPQGHHPVARPERDKKLISGNYAITGWITNEKSLDKLIDASSDSKIVLYKEPYDYAIRIAYQTPIRLDFKKEKGVEAISRTFEDNIVYTNLCLFQTKDDDGFVKVIHDIIDKANTFEELHKQLYDALRGSQSGQKAEFALDLIYSFDPTQITVPSYIAEGLEWLQSQLKSEE